tara:strand:- start:90 stop:290 length:201 start_codon:yes stop_codon:yes gene_type:complete
MVSLFKVALMFTPKLGFHKKSDTWPENLEILRLPIFIEFIIILQTIGFHAVPAVFQAPLTPLSRRL